MSMPTVSTPFDFWAKVRHALAWCACRSVTHDVLTRRWFIAALIAGGVLPFLLSASAVLGQAPEWEVGRLIGLRAGTCIREGPGLNYRAHTRVPENDWTAMVIDGPRQANGKTWYDTSRSAAGDPSGGTGWVMADWTDTDCANLPPVTVAPVNPPPSTPTPSPASTGNFGEMLQEVRVWWNEQSEVIKWLVAILLLVATVVIWRRISSSLIGLIFAVIEALIIWWILDQTRSIWQDVWESLVGQSAPDLAILLALIPLIAWGLSLVRKRRA